MATVQELPKVINGVNVEGLSATICAIQAAPEIAKFQFRLENEWEDAGQNRSTVGGFFGAGQEMSRPSAFVLKADEPVVLLGKDGAANPVEYLLHALAACITSSMVYHAALRGIHIEEVESSFSGDLDLRGALGLDPKIRQGYQGVRANFKIKADVSDEKLQELIQLGTGHSPVFDSLTNGAQVSVTAERL
jgi:uncharacterized OsmC-like protein